MTDLFDDIIHLPPLHPRRVAWAIRMLEIEIADEALSMSKTTSHFTALAALQQALRAQKVIGLTSEVADVITEGKTVFDAIKKIVRRRV